MSRTIACTGETKFSIGDDAGSWEQVGNLSELRVTHDTCSIDMQSIDGSVTRVRTAAESSKLLLGLMADEEVHAKLYEAMNSCSRFKFAIDTIGSEARRSTFEATIEKLDLVYNVGADECKIEVELEIVSRIVVSDHPHPLGSSGRVITALPAFDPAWADILNDATVRALIPRRPE